MGDYEDVLASLETLNHSVLKAMGYTKKVSGRGRPSGVQGLSAGLGLHFPRTSSRKGAWICDDKCWANVALKWALLGASRESEGNCEVPGVSCCTALSSSVWFRA